MAHGDRIEMGLEGFDRSTDPSIAANRVEGSTQNGVPNIESNNASYNSPHATNIANVQELPSARIDEFLTLGRPTRLNDFLPQEDPATHEQLDLKWRAAFSGNTSGSIRRPGTPVPTRDDVSVEDVRLRTPDIERLATLAPFSKYSDEPERGASNAALADGGMLNIQENRFPSESGPTRIEDGVNNRNPRARRHVGTLRRTTPEATQAFFGEFSDPENDRESNVN